MRDRNLEQISHKVIIITKKYKPSEYQLFVIVDLMKHILFSLSLILFEKSVIANTISLFSINLAYWIVLIKYEPSNNSKGAIFIETGNLAILIICIIWALDEKYYWWSEEELFTMGWIGVGLVNLIFIINLISSFILVIIENKEKIKLLVEKLFKRRTVRVTND